jgi:hypothetical protein
MITPGGPLDLPGVYDVSLMLFETMMSDTPLETFTITSRTITNGNNDITLVEFMGDGDPITVTIIGIEEHNGRDARMNFYTPGTNTLRAETWFPERITSGSATFEMEIPVFPFDPFAEAGTYLIQLIIQGSPDIVFEIPSTAIRNGNNIIEWDDFEEAGNGNGGDGVTIVITNIPDGYLYAGIMLYSLPRLPEAPSVANVFIWDIIDGSVTGKLLVTGGMGALFNTPGTYELQLDLGDESFTEHTFIMPSFTIPPGDDFFFLDFLEDFN